MAEKSQAENSLYIHNDQESVELLDLADNPHAISATSQFLPYAKISVHRSWK